MSRIQTPWQSYVSVNQEPFSFLFDSDGNLSIWTPRATAVVSLANSRHLIESAAGRQAVRPWMLPVDEFGTNVAIVSIHPLAVAHLMHNGQVDRNELLSHLYSARDARLLTSTVALKTPCQLLAALNRNRIGLRFSTQHNLSQGF